MRPIPAKKAPLRRARGAYLCGTCHRGQENKSRDDRAAPPAPHERPRPPASGRRHRSACAGGGRTRLSEPPQSRAARGGGDAGWSGIGAGRRRHRQDPRPDLPHRPYPQPGTGAAGRNPLGDLHQQGRARDETAAWPDARPGGRRHAVARHLPLHRRAHPAHPCRNGAVEVQFHRARYRRPDTAAQAVASGRRHRRQALAGADAGRPDRRLEEPWARAVAGAAGRSLGVRQRQGRQALCKLSGAAEDPQRRRFRRSAAGKHPPVPRAPGRAAKLSRPLQIHPGRRIPRHQRRAISLAAVVGSGAFKGGRSSRYLAPLAGRGRIAQQFG